MTNRVRGAAIVAAAVWLSTSGPVHAHADALATIKVVPDSGTGELVGLGGTMTIRIADGKHFYEFDYTKE